MNECPKLGSAKRPPNVVLWVQADQADAGGAPNTIRFDHPWAEQQIAQIACPPETSIRCAFTQRLSSDSSEAIIGPMSSGRPGRPSAVASAM